MKQFLISILLTFSSSLFSQSLQEFIPSNTPYVLSIHFGQINSKSQGLDYSKYLKSFIKNNRSNYYYSESEPCELIDIQSIIQTPLKFGIDINVSCFMYKTKVNKISGTVYLFQLSDPAKFAEAVTTDCFQRNKMQKRNLSNGYTYLTDGSSVAYNGNTAVIFVKDYSYYYEYSSESYSTDVEDSAYVAEKKAENRQIDSLLYITLNSKTGLDYDAEAAAHLGLADTMIRYRAEQRLLARELAAVNEKFDALHALLERFLSVQAQHIGQDRNFSKLLSDKNDVFIFMNATSFFNNDYFNPFNSYSRYDDVDRVPEGAKQMRLTENLSSFYTVNFENGKALVSVRNTYNKNVYGYMKKIYGVKQNKKLLKYIDGTDLLGYMSLAVDAKELAKFYEELYKEIFENMPKSKSERNMLPAFDLFYAFIDKEVLYNSLDGRAILACTGFTDIKVKYSSYDYDDEFNKKEITEERIVKQPRMVLAASIGNKENAQKLFTIISRFTVFTKLKENVFAFYGTRYNPVNMFFALTDDALIVSNDVNVVLHQLDGYPKSKQINKEDKKNILGHNLVMKIYADKILAGIQDNYLKTTANLPWFASMMNSFGNIEMHDDKPNGNMYGSTAVLILKDQSSNALFQLLKMMQTDYER